MARIHTVKAARKPQGRCMKCGTEIGVGDGYKWTAPRASKASSGWKKKICTKCSFRPSDTMSSPNLGALADAQQDFGSASLDSIEEIRAAAEALAEAIREVGLAYEESADSIESGFGHETYVSQEIREKAEGCESWADEIEDAASDLDEFDEDDARQEVEQEVADAMVAEADEVPDGFDLASFDSLTAGLAALDLDLAAFEERVNEAVEERLQEFVAEQAEKVQDAAGNQPF